MWKILRLTMVCVLGLSVNVFAADIIWTGAVSDRWDHGDNWNQGGVVPDSSYVVRIGDNTYPSTSVLIDSSTTAVCNNVKLGTQSGNTTQYTLTMTGGTLNQTGTGSGGRFQIGEQSGTNGVFNLSGGVVTVNSNVMLGERSQGAVNMSGGTFTVYNAGINMGARGGSYGELNLSGDGTINTPFVACGDDGGATAYVNMTGGVINTDTLGVNAYTGGMGGTMLLAGGTVNAGAVSMTNEDDLDGILDIAGGTLVLDGEFDSSWTYYVDGWVVANGGAGTLDFDYDGVSDTTTITAVPEPATLSLLALGGLGVLIRRK
ncbi:MAG: PEP-CTERM sorting domain-containing protein [Phycisphaerae bacterium]|nr:PEP-CTERM sorting domain-containing protein [Phycisphaerae bacterium]